ncbi:aprataxin [Anopheles bellator]|uniref:aprataxin n=1 Tax=Anopheles bellator TaxID=139047 RepID=UPI0026471667|nr:aprataxin [Anopheles bellator]
MEWGPKSFELIKKINDVQARLFVSELAVVIKDAYPIAAVHFLVLPWKDIDSVYDLTIGDISLLRHMEELGWKAVTSTGLPKESFDFGYHQKPSQRRLHLHVVSKDYHSPFLKDPFRWNAFHTDFFIKLDHILATLHMNGKMKKPSHEHIYALLVSPLRCNQCPHAPKTFLKLKAHLEQHTEEKQGNA